MWDLSEFKEFSSANSLYSLRKWTIFKLNPENKYEPVGNGRLVEGGGWEDFDRVTIKFTWLPISP